MLKPVKQAQNLIKSEKQWFIDNLIHTADNQSNDDYNIFMLMYKNKFNEH